SNKNYKTISIGGNIYQHTDIFASALMEIYEKIGRDNTDRIVMEAIYSLGQTTTMPLMAEYIFQADSALNNGNHYYIIVEAFVRRGILDSSYVSLNDEAAF